MKISLFLIFKSVLVELTVKHNVGASLRVIFTGSIVLEQLKYVKHLYQIRNLT